MYTTKKTNGRADLFPQIDRVLNEIFNTTFSHSTDETKSRFSQPSANVKEFNDRFEIHMAVPGFEKSDIAVKIEKHVLTISADKEVNAEGDFKMREFNYGKFERKFKLPEIVDVESVDATMEKGILTINIAKIKEAIDNGPKEIDIK